MRGRDGFLFVYAVNDVVRSARRRLVGTRKRNSLRKPSQRGGAGRVFLPSRPKRRHAKQPCVFPVLCPRHSFEEIRKFYKTLTDAYIDTARPPVVLLANKVARRALISREREKTGRTTNGEQLSRWSEAAQLALPSSPSQGYFEAAIPLRNERLLMLAFLGILCAFLHYYVQCDLTEQRCISAEQGAEFARSIEALFVETSAKTGTGIELAFATLVKSVKMDAPSTRAKRRAIGEGDWKCVCVRAASHTGKGTH